MVNLDKVQFLAGKKMQKDIRNKHVKLQLSTSACLFYVAKFIIWFGY